MAKGKIEKARVLERKRMERWAWVDSKKSKQGGFENKTKTKLKLFPLGSGSY